MLIRFGYFINVTSMLRRSSKNLLQKISKSDFIFIFILRLIIPFIIIMICVSFLSEENYWTILDILLIWIIISMIIGTLERFNVFLV